MGRWVLVLVLLAVAASVEANPPRRRCPGDYGNLGAVLTQWVRRYLRRTLNWPRFQIQHFLAQATPEDLARLADDGQRPATTNVYLGTQTRFDPSRAGTYDEVTNPATALHVFATTFGTGDGYVNIAVGVPTAALRGRMGEGDTDAYEQAQQLIHENLGGQGLGTLVRYCVPSADFARILQDCCSAHILRAEDPDNPSVPVYYVNPAREAEVHRLILDAVQREGDRYRVGASP